MHKKSDRINLSKSNLLHEHIKLIKLLKSGSLHARTKEATAQMKEMKKYKS